MEVGALAVYGRQPDYRGYKATGNKQVDEVYGGMSTAVNKAETESTGDILGLTTLPYSDTLSYGMSAAMGKWSDTHSMDFEKSLFCRYADESTENDPVVEVSFKRHGETVTEKIHLNDVNPRKATQQEMYALFFHQDQEDGTEGSYERLMQYAETAKKHGYWDGNVSYEDFSKAAHDWSDMLTKVSRDCHNLGLQSQADECEHLDFAMFRVTLKNIDLKQIKPVDMKEKTTLTPPKLILPDIPSEIGEALARIVFPFSESGERIRRFSWETENDIWFSMEYRIEKALNENGGRESIEKSWDTAISVLEDMLTELEDYFGEAFADDPAVRETVEEMREFYETVIQGMKDAKEEALGTAQTENTEEEAEAEDDLRSMLIDYMAELYSKIINGDTEQEFAIGSVSLTIREWEKLIDKLDDIEEEIRIQIKEEIRKIKETEKITDTERDPIEESTLLTSEVVTNIFGTENATGQAPSYITCFTAEGIICTKKGCAFGQYLWKMDYQNEEDYDRVMDLLHSFPSDWNLRFASNESFWKDYLEDRIDKEDFLRHMNEYTDKGNPNYLIEQNGSTYINREALKYSKYLNDPETKMYTAEEFRNLIAGRITYNRR